MKITVNIKTDYIKLGQFLKYANIVTDGAAAKHFLSDNIIKVDGVRESRRGRKLYPGTEIEITGSVYAIGKA
jgi:ribosome-associated protein